MRRSERWNNLQICPRRDSNTSGSDLWSNTLPLDHGGAHNNNNNSNNNNNNNNNNIPIFTAPYIIWKQNHCKTRISPLFLKIMAISQVKTKATSGTLFPNWTQRCCYDAQTLNYITYTEWFGKLAIRFLQREDMLMKFCTRNPHIGEWLMLWTAFILDWSNVVFIIIIVIHNILYSVLYNWTTIIPKRFTDKRIS